MTPPAFMQILPNCHAGRARSETFPPPLSLQAVPYLHGIIRERAMTGPNTHTSEEIDRKTSRSICDAVGERLQQSLKPHFLHPAPELDRLIEELDRREHESRTGTSGPCD
jgi:hypothetical protein